MADLFDIKVGGSGWHITSHLIALVALFVACFAITGYITFRDDSVPDSALKTEADTFDHIQTTVSPGLTAATHDVAVGTLPAGAVVTSVHYVTKAISVGVGADLTLALGDATDNDKFVVADDILATGVLEADFALGVGLNPALATTASGGTNVARDVIATFAVTTAALTTAGSYAIRVNYVVL